MFMWIYLSIYKKTDIQYICMCLCIDVDIRLSYTFNCDIQYTHTFIYRPTQ